MEEVLSSHDCLAVAVENFNIGDHMGIFTPCVVCNHPKLNGKKHIPGGGPLIITYIIQVAK